MYYSIQAENEKIKLDYILEKKIKNIEYLGKILIQ